MFNQQILYGYSHSLLTYEFLDSLLKKGFDINMELFNGDGEMGKDILYFYLQSYKENTTELFEIIEKILDSGFEFKQKYNYWFMFLQSLDNVDKQRQYYDQFSIEPSCRKILARLILKMMNKGMKTNDVCVYYDNITNKNKCCVLIDKTNKKDCELQFSSIVFGMGITFDNLFNKNDLIFDQNIVLAEEPHENIKYLCKIKDRNLYPYNNNGRIVYEIKKYTFTGFGGFGSGVRFGSL